MESDQPHQVRYSDSKNIALAVVVVVLSLAVALSGWLIISALDQIYSDPFEEEREYDVSGTMVVDGVVHDCTGSIKTHYASESEIYRIFTYHAFYSDGKVDREIKFSLMFDKEKNPVEDMYTYLGSEDGFDLWSGTDHGVDSVFYLDKDRIVDRIDFSVTGDQLVAMVKKR
jgi:hypothetical protein